jgi:hypothetical protein
VRYTNNVICGITDTIPVISTNPLNSYCGKKIVEKLV